MPAFRHTVLQERTLGGQFRAIQEGALDVGCLLAQIKDDDRAAGVEAFSKLFSCYRAVSAVGHFCLENMRDGIIAGHLDASCEFISVAPDVESYIPNIGGNETRVVESGEHQGMKAWVRRFLRSKGIQVPEDEVSLLGYKIDVGSLRDGIFVECGDTEPRKVIELLNRMLTVGLFPYDAEEVAWLKPKKTFADFSAGRTRGLLA